MAAGTAKRERVFPTITLPRWRGGARAVRHYVNHYIEEANAERAAELAEALRANAQSGAELYTFGATDPGNGIHHIAGPERATFSDFFRAANTLAGPDDLSVIANLDIVLPPATITTLRTIDLAGVALALTRWMEPDGEGGPIPTSAICQDTWVFQGQIRPMTADFFLGIGACDNVIASRIVEAGYRLENPSGTLRTIHRHRSKYRTWPGQPWIKGERLCVPACTATVE